MSGTMIPLMARGIDPWAAYQEFYGAQNAELQPAQTQSNIQKTQAETGLIGAQTTTEQQRPALIQAETGLAGAQGGLAGAEAGQAQAQSGLITQQTIGAGISNQIGLMGLGAMGSAYGAVTGGSNWVQPGALPWDTPQAPAGQIPGASGVGTIMPQSSAGNPQFAAPNPFIGGAQTYQAPPVPSAAPTVAPAGPAIGAPQPPSGQGNISLPSISEYAATMETPPPAPSGVPATPALDETMQRLRTGGQATAAAPQEAAIGTQGPTTTPVQGAPLPSVIGGAPPAQGAPAAAAAGMATAAPARPFLGPNAASVNGMPMPAMTYFGYMQALRQGNAAQFFQQYLADRSSVLGQRTMQSFNGDGSLNLPAWNQEVQWAFYSGYIDSAQAHQFYNNPDQARSLLLSFVSPDKQPMVAALVESAKAQNEGANLGPNDRRFVPGLTMPGGAQPVAAPGAPGQQQAAGAPAQPQQQAAGVPAPYGSPLAQKIQMAENNGPNPAQANESGPSGTPASTAMGNHQFTEGTWSAAIQQYGQQVLDNMGPQQRAAYGLPATLANLTPAQVQALRGNPAFSAAIVDARNPALAGELGAHYPGLAVTDAAIGLAHGYGTAGAEKLMDAPPGALLKDVLPEAAAANARDANTPVGQILQRYAGHYGTTPFAPWRGPVQQAAAGPADSGVNIQQLPGGGFVAQSNLTPQALEAQKANVGQVVKYQDELLDKSQAAARMNALIDQQRQESQSWTSGFGAPTKMAAFKAWDGIRQNVNAMLGKQVLGAPDQSVGDWEAFNKNAVDNVRTIVRETSARAAVQEFNMLRDAQPQDTTTPQGMRQLFDELQGINDWYAAKSAAAGRIDKATASGANTFDSEWNSSISPQAFVLHRMSVPDFQVLARNMSQTQVGRQTLDRWAAQMQFLDRHGYFHGGAALPVGAPLSQTQAQ